ncbi:MAG: hypothetical protein MN733_00340 [Nitrososphaera sp.]|nr:hypothetical protein [Nitrososphaera sp.]
MSTTKTRINISVSKEENQLLTKLARRDQVPRATKVRDLMHVAMDLEEDIAFSHLAEKRDVPGADVLSHEEFWKEVWRSRA